MKTAITLFFLLPSLNLYSQSAWFEQNSGTNQTLYSVDFIDKNTGVAVGSGGVIVRTTNAGNNWVTIPNNLNVLLNNIFFTDINTGYVLHSSNYLKTTDSGANWFYVSQIPPINGPFTDLFFLNSDTGYLASWTELARTTDGGLTWSTINIPSLYKNFTRLYEVYFFNFNTGYLTGYIDVYRTTNSGDYWQLLGHETLTYDFEKISENSSMCFTGQSYALLFTEYGLNGSFISPMNDGEGASFCNINLGLVIRDIGSQTFIHRTTNGGWHWEIIDYLNYDLFDIAYPDSNHAYMVGANGKILATRTGGLLGISPISSEIPNDFHLNQNYPNPFNPSTNIKFDIPQSGLVKIAVYDLLGKEVAVLVNEELKAGTYETQWNAESFSSGIYIVKMVSDDFSQTRKMILLK